MRTNRDGLKLIKFYEGFRAKAYVDKIGKGKPLTIGYGRTNAAGGPKIMKDSVTTEAEASVMLIQMLEKYERGVIRLVKVSLNENQFSALVSFTYNLGIGAFGGSSVLRAVNRRDFNAVPGKLALWNKSRSNGKLVVRRGLVRRRKAEGELFMKPPTTRAQAHEHVIVVVDDFGDTTYQEAKEPHLPIKQKSGFIVFLAGLLNKLLKLLDTK